MVIRFLLGAMLVLATLAPPAKASRYIVNGANPRAADTNPGTLEKPFKTIQQAANVALAGDTVLIEPGTYAESITVKNSGTASQPITFQAAKWHSVKVIAPDEHTFTLLQSGRSASGLLSSAYVTLRGIVFGHTAYRGWSGNNDFPVSVGLGHGWRVEDCVLDDNMGLGFGNGGGNDSNDVTLLRTIFEECNSGGVGASGDGAVESPNYLENTHVIDCIFRRNNPKNLDPGGYNGANKFLWHNGLVMDGVISYDNNGTGTWFDYGSTDFTVKNCTFFGNHAGYVLGLDGKPAGEKVWAGAGFWSEANPGPGLIENNVVYSNLGSGIGDLDSGSKGAIVIRNNWLVGNGSNGIEFRGMDDSSARRLGAAAVTGNVFKDNDTQWATSVEQNIPSDTPGGMGIVIDHNIYDLAPTAAGYWASWKPTKAAGPISASGLPEIRSKLKAEIHGQTKTEVFRGPLIHVYEYPTEADAVNPDPAKLHQVPSDAAERLSIDQAITNAHAAAGQVVTIPVFGHTPIVTVGKQIQCQVYDLQARYVTLLLPDAWSRHLLEQAVASYAIIAPTYLKVRLTQVAPYAVEARFVSIAQ